MSNDINTNNIEIKYSVEQTKAVDFLDYKEFRSVKRVLYGGQAGGGKSFIIAMWSYYMCMTYDGCRGYIARDAGLKKIKESVLVTCFDVWDSLGAKYRYNDKDSFIVFPNGSKIILLDIFHYPSDPNFQNLGSTEYTFGAIEEGINASKKACDLLITRTRYKHDEFCHNCDGKIRIPKKDEDVICPTCKTLTGGITPKQLISCNPDEGWIKEEIIIPHFELKLKPDTRFVPATLDSNPNKAFVKGYSATLDSMTDAYDRARLRNGDWFAQPRTGGEFYRSFSEDRNLVQSNSYEDLYISDDPLHITFDFNTKPYMTLCIHQPKIIDGRTEMVQIDEICPEHPMNNTRDTCKLFAKRYYYHESGLFIYGDPAGKHEDTRSEEGHNDYTIIRQELKKFRPTMRVAKSAPSIVMRGNFINDCFAGNVKNISIFIASNCIKTKMDYNFVKETADGKKLKKTIRDPNTGVSFEQYGHTSDANDYFYCEYFKNEYNLYVKGGSKTNGYIPNVTANNKTY